MSVFAFATLLTSCNNAESSVTPEEQQNQTFASKTIARETDSTDEKEAMLQAIEIIKKDMIVGGGSDSRINCHTPFGTYSGHACVFSGGYLWLVSWVYDEFGVDPHTGATISNPEIYAYTAVSVHSCRC